jgi:hypothetical protein
LLNGKLFLLFIFVLFFVDLSHDLESTYFRTIQVAGNDRALRCWGI